MKREQKIVSRFKKHVERTAQSFEDERATRVSKFTLLGEEIVDTERHHDRQEEKQVREVAQEIIELRQLIEKEIAIREKVCVCVCVCTSVVVAVFFIDGATAQED